MANAVITQRAKAKVNMFTIRRFLSTFYAKSLSETWFKQFISAAIEANLFIWTRPSRA